MVQRKSYAESCQQLIAMELIDEAPPLGERMPRYDDEVLSVNFFKTGIEGANLSCLTLPRTFFGRSEFAQTSFKDTDLRESNLCWNDFIKVDFSGADLGGCDLRASIYRACLFHDAKLDNADLRGATFDDCRFDGASLKGAILVNNQKAELRLSAEQVAAVAWTDDPGPEPDGG